MPIPTDAQKLQRRSTVRDEVYPTLQEWIVTGVLKPGEKLRDRDIAESLGVSRTPIREAFQRLVDEGLIETAPNSYTRVAPINVATAAHIYPIIGVLEPLAASLSLPRLTEEDLSAMAEANRRLKRALDSEHAVDASIADRDFHQVLADKADNPDLVKILDDLRVKLRRLEIVYFEGGATVAASIGEHENILDAIRAGNPDLLARALQEHWHEGWQRIVSQEQRFRSPRILAPQAERS